MLMISRPEKYQIVLAAFGTSRKCSAIYAGMQGRFEERFKQKIPLGFTSRVGEPKLKAVLEGLAVGNEAAVVVTPLFMISGKVVSRDIVATVRECAHRFRNISIAGALLPDDRIYEVVQGELASRLKNVKPGETGIIFVGHGTPDPQAALIYTECARRIATLFSPTVRTAFGNLESSAPVLGESLGDLIMSGIENLFIQPFMIVDGVHMHDDVRGALEKQDPDNTLYRFLLHRYGEPIKKRLQEIRCAYMPGLGAYPGVFELFADHTIRALAQGESPAPGERLLNL